MKKYLIWLPIIGPWFCANYEFKSSVKRQMAILWHALWLGGIIIYLADFCIKRGGIFTP